MEKCSFHVSDVKSEYAFIGHLCVNIYDWILTYSVHGIRLHAFCINGLKFVIVITLFVIDASCTNQRKFQ